MKINNIEGEVVKDNDVYILKDNTDLRLGLLIKVFRPVLETRIWSPCTFASW